MGGANCQFMRIRIPEYEALDECSEGHRDPGPENLHTIGLWMCLIRGSPAENLMNDDFTVLFILLALRESSGHFRQKCSLVFGQSRD